MSVVIKVGACLRARPPLAARTKIGRTEARPYSYYSKVCFHTCGTFTARVRD